MKKIFYGIGCLMIAGAFAACGGGNKSNAGDEVQSDSSEGAKQMEEITLNYSAKPLEAETGSAAFAVDEDGYITIFDGKTLTGWRGYAKDSVPGKWSIDTDGTLKFTGSGGGEAQEQDGGDLIFAHKFKNFELQLEWKISKGGNSGIFYLAQEVKSKDKNGNDRWEPIYISAPEYQLLDNENHIDAGMGKDGNRKAGSLYDMIPADPQNAKPFGEWNKAKIIVFKGTVVHAQNDENVLEYHLWTPQWTDMLQVSKFKEGSKEFPLAFDLLNNAGGENREGYIGLQDHSDDVWFRNIKVKVLD